MWALGTGYEDGETRKIRHDHWAVLRIQKRSSIIDCSSAISDSSHLVLVILSYKSFLCCLLTGFGSPSELPPPNYLCVHTRSALQHHDLADVTRPTDLCPRYTSLSNGSRPLIHLSVTNLWASPYDPNIGLMRIAVRTRSRRIDWSRVGPETGTSAMAC
jgi:hypothetical protein